MGFCSICTAPARDAEDLQPGDDGALECRRCREEHPRAGGYSFDDASGARPNYARTAKKDNAA